MVGLCKSPLLLIASACLFCGCAASPPTASEPPTFLEAYRFLPTAVEAVKIDTDGERLSLLGVEVWVTHADGGEHVFDDRRILGAYSLLAVERVIDGRGRAIEARPQRPEDQRILRHVETATRRLPHWWTFTLAHGGPGGGRAIGRAEAEVALPAPLRDDAAVLEARLSLAVADVLESVTLPGRPSLLPFNLPGGRTLTQLRTNGRHVYLDVTIDADRLPWGDAFGDLPGLVGVDAFDLVGGRHPMRLIEARRWFRPNDDGTRTYTYNFTADSNIKAQIKSYRLSMAATARQVDVPLRLRLSPEKPE
ncbi:MAG: hypothetical protein AAGG38_12190 [Planctomycetota bacterium]